MSTCHVTRPRLWSLERFGKVALLLSPSNGDHNGGLAEERCSSALVGAEEIQA